MQKRRAHEKNNNSFYPTDSPASRWWFLNECVIKTLGVNSNSSSCLRKSRCFVQQANGHALVVTPLHTVLMQPISYKKICCITDCPLLCNAMFVIRLAHILYKGCFLRTPPSSIHKTTYSCLFGVSCSTAKMNCECTLNSCWCVERGKNHHHRQAKMNNAAVLASHTVFHEYM